MRRPAVSHTHVSALDLLKDLKGSLPRGAVNASARGLAHPRECARLDMGEIAPGFAAKEALAHIGHPALDVRFACRHAHGRGIDDEAAMARVLLHRPLKD